MDDGGLRHPPGSMRAGSFHCSKTGSQECCEELFINWFSVEPQFWMNLQTQHDLAVAGQEIGEAVEALPTARQIA